MSSRTGSCYVIRDYDPRESRMLHRIDCVCFPPGIAYSYPELRFYLRHPKSIARVAESEGRVAGFVIGRREGRIGHVVTLDVLPEDRRNGVGASLMAVLHGEFRNRNALVSYLEVSTANRAALRFYEKLGYGAIEKIRGYYAGREDAYRMTLLL